MMSAILRLLSLMPFMVRTTSATTSPPCVATVWALSASWLAARALSAFWRTVELSSSIEAEVSSRALACCSVRADRSLLPWAISALAVATPSAPRRTSPTMPANCCCMAPSVCSNWPGSSLPVASRAYVRSPCAMACASWRLRCTGCTIERVTSAANAKPSAMAASAQAPRIHSLVWATELLRCRLSVKSWAMCWRKASRAVSVLSASGRRSLSTRLGTLGSPPRYSSRISASRCV